MELIATLWFVWAACLILSFLNRRFTIHDVRTGVGVSMIRWLLTQGFFWGSVGVSALSIVLNVIKFTKS